MKLLLSLVLLVTVFSTARAQAVDTLVPSQLIVPARYASIYDSAHTVYLPKGFQCSVFYTQTGYWGPRLLAMDPSGRLCVADIGLSQVLALPDKNHVGAADTAIQLAYNDVNANSIAFYKGALYTIASGFVMKFEHPNAAGLYVDSSIFIANIPDTAEGSPNHTTRTILFDTIGKNLFLSVGAPCNACREKATERASILKFNLDGSGRSVYATGLRNAVGLTLDQQTYQLWASVEERNSLGADIPGDFLTRIVDGGFYGWPIAYGDHVWDNFQSDSEYKAILPLNQTDSSRVNSMQVADLPVDAHSTPLDLAFYYGSNLPSKYNGNLFFTEHGSYQGADGRVIADGSKLLRAQNINGKWKATDFATGFLTDSINYTRWARPCGILLDTNGDIYFTSDHIVPHAGAAVFKISYVGEGSVASTEPSLPLLRIYPNPASDRVMIEVGIEARNAAMVVNDILGNIRRRQIFWSRSCSMHRNIFC